MTSPRVPAPPGPRPPAGRPVDLLALGETMVLVAPRHAVRLESAEEVDLGVGGAESNVARHLAAAGRRAAWFGAVGEDALGRRVLRTLAEQGVDVTAALRDPTAPTGLYLKDPGHGVVYHRAGSAASRLRPADLAAVDLARARILHLSGITLALSDGCRDLVHAAIDAARAHGTLVSLDVNHRPALWPDGSVAAAALLAAAERADVVLVGRDEAEALWGTPTADAVRELLPDVPTLVVKDADVEAVEFTAAGRTAVPARAVEVVEPVGAGDAFAAGWLDALLDGDGPAGRLARGHALAALTLRSTTDVPAYRPGPDEGAPPA